MKTGARGTECTIKKVAKIAGRGRAWGARYLGDKNKGAKMNKINEKMDCQTRPCKSAVSGDWRSADLTQKSKTELHHSPRAGAKIFARRIGSTPQIAHIQKSGAQSYARSPRSFEAVAQAGRSMIEMLGVLAIIGVLTIGGLMGYRYAMNKHKANTILNDVSLAMADLTVQDPDGGAIARQAVAFNPDSGLAMESERTEDGNNIVYVNGVAKAVCQILIQIKPTDAYENIYDGDLNALTSCSDNQTMAFGSKDSGEPPVTKECDTNADCAADQICLDGQCVDKPEPTDPCEDVECFNGGTCNEGSCDCIDGYTGTNCEIEPDCNDSKPCTSPKQCENYICVCPKIANCKTLNNSTCECNKCEDGYEMVDGKCVKNDCPTGQKSVTNYDSAGNIIGTVCCTIGEDQSATSMFYQERSGYTVAGAINGTCCGGYTKDVKMRTSDHVLIGTNTYAYKVLVNQTAYCATEQQVNYNKELCTSECTNSETVYSSDGTKYCTQSVVFNATTTKRTTVICYKSDNGAPKNAYYNCWSDCIFPNWEG